MNSQPEPTPAPSLIEAAGVRTRLPRDWPRLVAVVVVLVVVVWGLWALVSGMQALNAVRDAEAALRNLENRVDLDLYLDGDLDGDIEAAVEALQNADERLDATALKPVKILPFVGRQLRSAQALTASGLELARSVSETGESVRSILDDTEDRPIHEQLELAATQLDSMLKTVRGLDLGPDNGLTGRLQDGRSELAEQLRQAEPQLDTGSQLLFALADLLRGPENHLLLIANNAEARAGSGMILTTGVLRTANGEVEVTDLDSSFDRNLPVGLVQLTKTYTDHFGFLTPEAEWRNLAVTPRFPETAESALRMWAEATGEQLDGVILVDPFLLQALLVGTGPIEVDDITLDEGNVIDYLLHDQYLDIDVAFTNTERRSQERLLAELAISRVQNNNVDLAALVPALLDAAERRHLMVWASDRDRQLVWENAGVDGDLGPNSLMVSSSNRSPSKLDYFVEIRSQVTTEIVDSVRRVEVLIAIDNTVDPREEPIYIAGPADGSSAQAGEYVALVTLNVPGAATGARFDGVADLSVAGADGPTRILATSVSVFPGERVFVTARFELPLSVGVLDIEPSARSFPVQWNFGDARITDDSAFSIDLDSGRVHDG